jgi:hypothetical protein
VAVGGRILAIMSDLGIAGLVIGGFCLVGGCIAGGCWALPQYNVYEQRLTGEAELQKAEYSKRIAVETAKATKDSAVLLAEAEALRAEGVAKANKIIGDSLKDNEGYLRYLWIHGLQDGKNEVIYVPTEANLPILEANRKHREPAVAPVK